MKKFSITFLIFILIFNLFLSSTFANNNSKLNSPIITVEAFVLETLSDTVNSMGIYELTGYKEVNSITEIKEGNNEIYTKITAIEDYYDIAGNYIKTIVKNDEFENDYNTGKAFHTLQEKVYRQPLAINIRKGLNYNNEIELNTAEEKLVKQNIGKIKQKLPNGQTKEIKGFTKIEIDKLKATAQKIINSNAVTINKEGHIEFDPTKVESEELVSSLSYSMSDPEIERKGAFDNYYNHNLSNGSFIAQALGAGSHKYIKVTGTTFGSTKNAQTMGNFKSHINNYQDYVVRRMNSSTFNDVAGWFGVLMGLGSMVTGYSTGPAGWVSIVLYYGGAFSTFLGLTSTAYATHSRMELSKLAAQYCESARNIVLNYHTQFEKYNVSVVDGF